MDNEQTMPDWVLIEAAKRGERPRSLTVEDLRHQYINSNNHPMYRALCEMILKHEQPPVDRKLLCAREAVNLSGGDRYSSWFRALMQETAARAIELWEEGFGK